MPFNSNIQGTTQEVSTNTQWTGVNRFNGGSGFVIVDPTDATKSMIFNLSGLTTGTQTEFTVPESDSSIVTLTAAQSLTNKSLDDTTTTFFDTASPTKLARFECSSITAGQTRVVTVPDSNGTIAYLAGSTLTTTTLTSPTVNTPAISGGTFTRTAQVYFCSAPGSAKVGATAGWVVAAAANTSRVTLPTAQTGSTLVLPIVAGLKVGWTITGFYVLGQIESAGNIVTLDANLFKLTGAAGDLTDASIGAITQISVTADTLVSSANATKTLDTPEVISGLESFYVLLTGTTTTADCDIDLMGVGIIVTEV